MSPRRRHVGRPRLTRSPLLPVNFSLEAKDLARVDRLVRIATDELEGERAPKRSELLRELVKLGLEAAETTRIRNGIR